MMNSADSLPGNVPRVRSISIRGRLTIAFMVIVLLSATAISVFSGLFDLKGEQQQVAEYLETIAALIQARIEDGTNELQDTLATLLTEPMLAWVAPMLDIHSAPPSGYSEAYLHLRDDFEHLASNSRLFSEVFLMNDQGNVVMSTDGARRGIFEGDREYFRAGLEGPYLYPPFHDPESDQVMVIAARPVVDGQGQVLGVLAGRASLTSIANQVFEQINFGKTGALYLIDSGHTLLTNLRLPASDAPLEGSPIYINTEGANAALASRGKGVGLYTGFGGVPVVGVYRWLAPLQAALLIEQDQTEAFRSAYEVLALDAVMTVAILFVTLIAALLVVRSITSPLASLAETATRIAGGDLDLQASVKRDDEIGALARAFNHMTARLRELIDNLKHNIAEREQAALTLQTSLRESHQRQAEVTALLDGARVILEQREFSATAKSILEACERSIGATLGLVGLLAHNGDSLDLVYADPGMQAACTDPAGLALIHALRDQARRTSRPVFDNQAASAGRNTPPDEEGSAPQNLLVAPMVIKGFVVGLLCLANKPGGFTDGDARIASAFAELVAIGFLSSRTLELLERSEEQFRSVAQTAVEAIIIVNSQSRIDFWNKAAGEVFGYTASEAIRLPLPALLPERFREAIMPSLTAEPVAEQEGVIGKTIELVGLRKDGSEFPMELSLAGWHTREGRFATGVARDITERKQVEEALRKTRDELELRVQERTAELRVANTALQAEIAKNQLQAAALEAAANGILITNRTGEIEWCNTALTHMTGYSSTEIAMQNPRMFKSGLHDSAYYWNLWRTILAGKVWHGQIINRRKNGSLYTEEQTIAPVFGDGETITHFIAIKQDVSDRIRAEEEIRRRNRDLEVINAIGAAVSSSLELPEMLASLTQLLAEGFDLPGGAIFLFDGADNQLRLSAAWGLPAATQPTDDLIPAEAFHCDCAIRQTPLNATDAQPAAAFFASRLNIILPEWPHNLCVPLLAQSKIQGVLDLFKHLPEGFSPNEIHLFKALGHEIGVAVHNARLYQAELQARQMAEVLGAASVALTQALDLDIVLDTLLDHLGRLIPYTAARALLLEDDSHVTIRVMRGDPQPRDAMQSKSPPFDIGEIPILGNVLLEQKSVLVPDVQERPDWNSRLSEVNMRSWLGVPLAAGGKVIGLCSISGARPATFTQEHVHLAEALAGQATVAVHNAWLFEQVRAGRERLQALSRRLVEIQESERRYVARELHDEAGQALTALMVGLRLLEREANHPKAVVASVAELKRTVNNVLENLHRLAIDLRPASLDHLGLVPALRQHVEAISDRHGLTLQFEAIGLDYDRLPPEMETAIYRIVQEALTNAVRHAQATRVDVLLERRAGKVIALVEDNGVGFDTAAAHQRERLGLFGMRERAEMFAGTLVVESAVGFGTTVRLEMPYDAPNSDRG